MGAVMRIQLLIPQTRDNFKLHRSMNDEILHDDKQSIAGRDYRFETEVMKRLFGEYVQKYVDRIHLMDKEESFVHDDSFHGVKSHNHIMYKLKVGQDGGTSLPSKDGNRGYEFLVEFDKDDPEYGIYYGCRGLIYGGDQQEQIDIFLSEWENNIKPEVCAVLNNTFIDMDFTNRFQATNNASNKTFWPFWIALGEGEDVVKIAALATKLIANIYRRYLSGKELCTAPLEKKVTEVQTRYTNDEYRKVLKLIEKERGVKAMEQYIAFINAAVKKKILVRDDRYEKCWKFVGLKNIVVGQLINMLCDEIDLKKDIYSDSNKDRIPWKYFTPVFLSSSDEPFDSLRKSVSLSKDAWTEDHKKTARSILSKLKIIK